MYPPTLRWLARARSQRLRRQFYIIASPDPRICAGFTVSCHPPGSFPPQTHQWLGLHQPLEKQYNHYMLRFGSGCWPGTDRYDSINPTYAWVFDNSFSLTEVATCDHRHAYNYSPTSLPLQTDYFKRTLQITISPPLTFSHKSHRRLWVRLGLSCWYRPQIAWWQDSP